MDVFIMFSIIGYITASVASIGSADNQLLFIQGKDIALVTDDAVE